MSGSHGGNGSRRNWCQKVTFKVRHVPRVMLSVGHRVLARVKPENALAMGLQLFFDTHPATWDDKPPRDAGIEPRPASEFITASTRSPASGQAGPTSTAHALRWLECRGALDTTPSHRHDREAPRRLRHRDTVAQSDSPGPRTSELVRQERTVRNAGHSPGAPVRNPG